MPRWPWSRRSSDEQPDLTKAAPVAGGAVAGTFTTQQVANLATALAQQSNGQMVVPAQPLPRDPLDATVPFGPGVPLFPQPIDPSRTDTHRPEPRLTEYPVSVNLPGVQDRIIPWKVLRDAADIGMIRRCVEIKKAELAGMEWGIRITKRAVDQAMREAAGQQNGTGGKSKPGAGSDDAGSPPSAARRDVEERMRDELRDEIARLTAFWDVPDRGNGLDFTDWMSAANEEALVLDALAVYPRMTLGGDKVHSLEILDGSTIKPLRDHRGGRPQPPNPAYQQLLYGFPRGEFVADVAEDPDTGAKRILNGFTADRLFYRRRVVRAWTPYGFSPVEQALRDFDVWLQRIAWIKAEYTDGVMPSGWLTVDSAAPDPQAWTPERLQQYEAALNGYLAGNTAERHRFKLLPPGIKPADGHEVADKYKPDYDLFLLKMLVANFELTIADLGFTEAKGLGSSGYHEGQEDVEDRKGRRPYARWMQAVLTQISREVLGMDPRLEFCFLGLEAEDEAVQDEIADRRVKSGRMTLNEDRDRTGMPRFDLPEADEPMIYGQRGVIFLSGQLDAQINGQAAVDAMVQSGDGPKDNNGPGDGDGTQDGDTEEPAPGNGKPPAKPAPAAKPTAQQTSDAKAKADEAAAYKRWVGKGSRGREFVWHHHTEAEADLVKAEAGGGRGRPESRREGGVASGEALPASRPEGVVVYRPGC